MGVPAAVAGEVCVNTAHIKVDARVLSAGVIREARIEGSALDSSVEGVWV